VIKLESCTHLSETQWRMLPRRQRNVSCACTELVGESSDVSELKLANLTRNSCGRGNPRAQWREGGSGDKLSTRNGDV
jgi:hypothetical protein